MKNFGDLLFGDSNHFIFENRIFNFAMLLGITMTFFGTVMDIYYRVYIMIDLSFLCLWFITYYLARFKDYFRKVYKIAVVIFVFIFIPIMWMSSGGSNGILPYYTIVFVAIIGIILKERFRIVILASMLVVELLLLLYDAYRSGNFDPIMRTSMSMYDYSVHIIVIMSVLAVLMIVYSNTYMNEKKRSDAYAMSIEESYTQQLYYMQNLEQVIYQLKSERHDFNNHLGVIFALLENNETEKAFSYTKQLVKTAQEYQNMVNLPYPMLRAMLNYKLSAAIDRGIDVKLNIRMPDGLDLNEFDLTVILGNLLDNAIEANSIIEQKYIALDIIYDPSYMIIHEENPQRANNPLVGKRRYTSKHDTDNHGFGLNNIEYIVNKHNGFMQIVQSENLFTINIAILAEFKDK